MVRPRPHSGIHCLNCDLWDSRIAMIFRSHCPDRDSTPCLNLEQASMSKSQHGLVGAQGLSKVGSLWKGIRLHPPGFPPPCRGTRAALRGNDGMRFSGQWKGPGRSRVERKGARDCAVEGVRQMADGFETRLYRSLPRSRGSRRSRMASPNMFRQ